ncbi:MAG: ATP-binding cassette domain-containing protein [Zhengella sp.]|uniref:ATP-binding cassette domain-containing protein n=1 Tax=Zhengella sp. TaxID=2282762 RepID=UPI003527A8C9
MIDYRRRMRVNLAIAATGLALFAVFPLFANSGLVFLAGLVAINIVFGLSWNLLFSGVGLLSFGHAMFFAGGAYAMAVLSLRVPELPFVLGLFLGALTGGLIALVFGFIALRRASGVYFAVLTLAFSELIHIFITKTTFLGRNDGLVGIPRPVIDLGIASIDLTSAGAYYYFIILAMAAVAFALWAFQNSPAGRLIRAIKQDPVARSTAFLRHRYTLMAAHRLRAVRLDRGILRLPSWCLSPRSLRLKSPTGQSRPNPSCSRCWAAPGISGARPSSHPVWRHRLRHAGHVRPVRDHCRCAAAGRGPADAGRIAGLPARPPRRCPPVGPCCKRCLHGQGGESDMTRLMVAKGIHKSYGRVRVLEDVDFDLEEGEAHVVIGPNGAGKTTLFRCLSGESRINGGTITLGGRDITALDGWQRVKLGIGRSFQVARIFPDMSAFENLIVAIETRERVDKGLKSTFGLVAPRREVREEAERLVVELGWRAASTSRPARFPMATRGGLNWP